ncbi:pyridoxal-phosphate dependent enzyme [Endozoicomonas sp. SM1973]|uniref:L-serine ammonia-lyase n=1 Tax=Spartinivicinus marinus TaxID=2994442 RepID=A0A853HVV9_9GAMM|nr:pyridoxal-phosphate dependent enzyme [Spartinivicinus marinus]MCX4026715.1 pyridoxal-phosphate dependent enzyme [Spartinivicinus marinus]NYZ64549.1 pyridoxal-phosphate dependent enzyme [Spartinivicinus marinus]
MTEQHFSPLHWQTPVIHHQRLSQQAQKQILLKMECWQPTASFKIRGIGLTCQHYASQGVKHFICASGGNAGYAVAYAARQLKIPATIVVPETTTEHARELIEEQLAELVVVGKVWDEANQHALQLTEEPDTALIHPFDDPLIWQGHASIVTELKQQIEKPDAIVLSVGGGGLLSGVIKGLMIEGWEDVPVIAVETEGAASFNAAMKAGEPIMIDKISTVATSLGARQVAKQAVSAANEHTVHSITVSDQQAVAACLAFANHQQVIVEPACGATLSPIYCVDEVLEPYDKVVAIVCGGMTMDFSTLCDWHYHF